MPGFAKIRQPNKSCIFSRYNWWLNALIPHRYKCVITDLEIYGNSFETRQERGCSNFDQTQNYHDAIVFLMICFRANEEKFTQNLHDMQIPYATAPLRCPLCVFWLSNFN